MKRITSLLLLTIICGTSQVNAARYVASATDTFIVIAQHGGFSNHIVSVRKSAVISIHLYGKKIILISSGRWMVDGLKDGKKRKVAQSMSDIFISDSQSDAKELFASVMQKLESESYTQTDAPANVGSSS